MSPYSANKSCKSSSEASSWMFVAMTIQPSMLRTATALAAVRASAPAEGFVEPLRASDAGGALSISISVDIIVSIIGDVLQTEN